MARRRFNRSKTAPDMGWVVGTFATSVVEAAGGGNEASIVSLFDFADVDADALTGRIEQDKSDWFVKRVIVDVYAAVSFDGTGPTDVARLWALGLGVVGNADADEISSNNYGVYSAEATNLYARTFRTYSRPVYAGGIIGYTGDFNIATENVTTGGPVGGWSTTAPFWGDARIHDDFEVSNAGLRNNQSVVAHISLLNGPGSFDWDVDDVLYLEGQYRVLMQKRR